MAVPNMIVTLVANTTKFASGMKQADGVLERFGNVAKFTLGTFASLLAGAAVAFGRFAVDAIGDASRLEQAVGGTKAVFGDFSDEVQRMSEAAAKNVGLSMEKYQQVAALTGTLLKASGIPMDKLAGKTDELITLAADLAATFGGTVEEAATAMNAALRKEYEPIRRFGISLSEVQIQQKALEMTRKKSISSLTQQEKLLATQALLFEQGASAMGQFGRESDTLNNKQQVMQAQWDNLSATLGEKLLPIASQFVDALSTMLEDPQFQAALDKLVSQFEAFGVWMGSPQGIKSMQTMADIITGLITIFETLVGWISAAVGALRDFFGLNPSGALTSAPGMAGYRGGNVNSSLGARPAIPAPVDTVVVNVNGINPTAVVGRTVLDALTKTRRLGIR